MRLIAVAGSCPGIGKSTLCTSLVRWLADTGLRVDHFEQEHVLTRPQFAQVAAEFTGTGIADGGSFVAGTVRYLADAAAAGVDLVVADALVPYVSSLLAFGHAEQSINTVLDDLARRIVAIPTLVVYLDGHAATALGRAVEREGPDWLDWFGAKLARYGQVPAEPEWAELCGYLSHQRATELRVLRRQPWDLVVVERADEVLPDAVLSTVSAAVGEFVGVPEQ